MTGPGFADQAGDVVDDDQSDLLSGREIAHLPVAVLELGAGGEIAVQAALPCDLRVPIGGAGRLVLADDRIGLAGGGRRDEGQDDPGE